MKAEYINPFVESARSVLNMLCGIEPKADKARLRSSPFLAGQVVIMIGIIGMIKGQVLFELSIDTAKRIVSSMMGGMDIMELDEISKSAVSELGNMIMGNTSIILANNNIHIDITPPSLLTGDHFEITHNFPTVVVPLEIEGFGTVNINVSAEELTY